MPSKKIDWDNVPHINHVTKMDVLGKWIQCSIFLVWSLKLDHNSASQSGIIIILHSRIGNCENKQTGSKGITKTTSYFEKMNGTDKKSSHTLSLDEDFNRNIKGKTAPRPGFFYRDNSDLIHLHEQIKKDDSVNYIRK